VTKRVLKAVISYGAGAAALAYVLATSWAPATGEPGLAQVLVRPVSAPALALAALMCLVGLLANFYRWAVLVRAQGMELSAGEAVRLGFVGYFVGTFLPGAVGGDVVRAAFFARQQSRRAVAVGTVIMDRLLGLLGLLWLVALGGGLGWVLGHPALVAERPLQVVVLTCTGVCAATAVPWLLLGWLPWSFAPASATKVPWLGRVGAELAGAIRQYRSRPGTVAFALALSLVAHSAYVVAFWAVAGMSRDPEWPAPPSLTEHFVLVPVGAAVQMLFPSPGGVGGGEYGFGRLYALVGKAPAAGVLACAAHRLVLLAWGAAGYFGCLALRRRAPAAAAEPAPPPARAAA
jgi:uncharacterized membrane protein YbhN (UPF0104 family)